MIDRVGTMKGPEAPLSDMDVAFLAAYNLLLEKLEQEPKKGIVLSKGNPNQRKVSWKKVMQIMHSLEDYFTFWEQVTGSKRCSECQNWENVSEASPHLGRCNKYKKYPMHGMHSCKKGFIERGAEDE